MREIEGGRRGVGKGEREGRRDRGRVVGVGDGTCCSKGGKRQERHLRTTVAIMW